MSFWVRCAMAAEQAERRYAAWDPAAFEEFCREQVATLAVRLEGEPDADACVDALLTLGAEALARGHVGAGAPRTFLDLGLRSLAPALVPAVPAGGRVQALARLWNVGEGLLAEPPWLDAMVRARAGELTRLEDLERFVEAAITPVLVLPPPSGWAGPFTARVVDTRPLDDLFLPGALHIAAPSVVCVRDQRRPACLGLVLRRGEAELMGPLDELPPWESAAPAPAVTVEAPYGLRVGVNAVPLPQVHTPAACLAVPGGFVVVSSADSQRLWVLEAAP